MRVLVLLLLMPVLSAVAAGLERTVEKEFQAGTHPTLHLEICQGPVRIETATDGHIHFLMRESIEAASETAADEAQKELLVDFRQEAGDVRASVRFRRSVRWAWESWPPVALACTIRVPRTCNLDLVLHDGDLTVGALDGRVSVRTDSGAIFTGEMAGPLTLESRRGDVSVTACRGELMITAKSGNVTVGRVSGPTVISASGGLVEVQSVRGKLRIDADGADIRAGFAHPCLESAELRAAGGDVAAIFDLRDAFTLKARSSRFGQVSVKNLSLAVASGKPGTSSVVGTLNGGGPLVEIESSGGNVRLIGREP